MSHFTVNNHPESRIPSQTILTNFLQILVNFLTPTEIPTIHRLLWHIPGAPTKRLAHVTDAGRGMYLLVLIFLFLPAHETNHERCSERLSE